MATKTTHPKFSTGPSHDRTHEIDLLVDAVQRADDHYHDLRKLVFECDSSLLHFAVKAIPFEATGGHGGQAAEMLYDNVRLMQAAHGPEWQAVRLWGYNHEDKTTKTDQYLHASKVIANTTADTVHNNGVGDSGEPEQVREYDVPGQPWRKLFLYDMADFNARILFELQNIESIPFEGGN